jgi:radical SAM superfamily enzyme YgiQ (UPF0313 family)
MKILLCNVSKKYETAAHDYVGLFYLAGALEAAGFEPLVFHGKAEGLLDEIARHRPEAVGFSCDFDNVRIIEDVSQKIKERWGIPVVVGGPQSIALGRTFLESSGVD